MKHVAIKVRAYVNIHDSLGETQPQSVVSSSGEKDEGADVKQPSNYSVEMTRSNLLFFLIRFQMFFDFPNARFFNGDRLEATPTQIWRGWR